MQNTTVTYKKTTKKLLTKIITKYFSGDKKSQNCLVVGRTWLKIHKQVSSWRTPVEKSQTSY